MKLHKKRTLLVLTCLMLLLMTALGAWWFEMNTSSELRLWANPQGNAAACVHHPSAVTCQGQVSPFGTGSGVPSCASQATIPALIDLTDPSRLEVPLATLEVWHSPVCRSAFASAYTSTLLGASSLTVSIAARLGWWQHALRETTLHISGGADVHAWTPLLYLDDPMPQTVEACITIRAEQSYRACTTVSL